MLRDAETLPDARARALVRALGEAMVDMIELALERAIDHGADANRVINDPVIGELLALGEPPLETPVGTGPIAHAKPKRERSKIRRLTGRQR